MPIYRYNNKVYDIPEDKIEDFENTYPNAYIELYANNKAYNIPSKLRKSFQQKYADWAYLSPAERNLSAPFDADADTGPYPPNIQGDESTNKHAANLAQYTFKAPELISATEVLQRNAETLTGINGPAGLTKSPDPIQQAVSQDLINKAASQEWQRDTLKHYQSEKERLQALYNQEIAKTSGRQFSSSFMGYNPSADTAMSRDASLYSLALQYLGDAEKQIIKAQKKSKASTPQQRNADDNYDLSQWQQSPSQYGYAPISIPGVKAPNKEQSQSPDPIQEAVAGVGDALFDIDTLTLGLDSLSKNATLKAILDKADADQPLTQAEESLLNAALYKQFTEAALPNGRWYNVGKGIGEQVPYMLEFALSGGVAGALTKGASKAIGKQVVKYINNLALKNGSKIANRTARNVFTRGSRMLGNTLYQLPGGVMRAAVQAPLRSSVYNNIIERQIGTLDYKPGEDGTLDYTGRIGADNTADAIIKGLTSGFITNLTESSFGEGIQFITNKIGGLMGKGINAVAKDFRSPRWYNHIREGLRRNGWAQFISASSLQGPVAEYGEEILDQTLNAIFVGDSSLDPNSENYVFDLDNLIDTAITTGAISLFMGAAGGIASGKIHRDVNKAYALAEQNLRTLHYSDTEINALNNIATSRPQEASKWVSSITRTMRTLAIRSAEIENSLSPEARQYLDKENSTKEEFNELSPYDQQAVTAFLQINNRFKDLTIQRDYVVAGTNYNALIKGLKESVAPQAEAVMADIQANALRDSDYTVKVKFKGQDGYLVSGTADIDNLPDGSTVATLPEGNIYQVRTKSPDGQWLIQQAIAEDIQPISVTPTQQLIDETTARIYSPVQNLINAEQAQAQAEVAQSQPPVPAPASTTPTAEQREANTPPLPEGIGEVARSDGGVNTQPISATPTGLNAPEAPNGSTQSTEEQPLSDEQFDEHIATLPTGDAIQSITQRRGAEEADQYAQWRKGILTKERDKAHKTLNAKHKPFDPSRYTDYAQMKREERKHNDAIQATRNEALGIINRTTAEIADIDRYLANRNRQIAAEREAENPLRNGIAPAVAKLSINTLEQYIARYIALGGRLRMTDQYSNGLAAELGITPGSQEHRELLSILSNTEGMTPEQLAHDISENIEPEYRHLIAGRDVQDIRNAIIDTIASGVTSRRRAYQYIADANEKLSADEQRYIEEQELQAQIDADTEQAIRDYEELLLSSLTSDDLAIIDTMAGDYSDEILAIQQYDQEAYNSLISPSAYSSSASRSEDRGGGRRPEGLIAEGVVSNSQNIQTYDTNPTSTTPRITQQGAESTAIQSSTQPSNTTPIRQDSQDTATIRPETPQTSRNSSTRQDVVEQNNKPTLLDVVHTLYSKGKEVASKLFSMKFFDVATTPKFMQELGLRGDKFTIRYGVIARHFEKDVEHTLPQQIWEQLPYALQNPFAITKYYKDNNKQKQKGYRIYTTLQLANGSYIVVSAEVKNSGRDIEVNAINTIFGRSSLSDVHDELIYTSETITPEQQSLLNGNNPHQYTAERELYTHKDTSSSSQSQEINEEINKQVAQAEAEVNTNPTETQKENIPAWLEKVPNDGRNFFVYVKFADAKNYQAIDLAKGVTVDRLVYASSVKKDKLRTLVEKLPNALLEDAEFQIRDAKGKVFYDSIKEKVQASQAPNGSNGPNGPTTDSYTITPTQYTTKRRNVLNMHLVKFTNDLTKEQYRTAKELAKADKGWWDKSLGGFMMRSQESAQQLADTIASQPISMTDIKALNDGDIEHLDKDKSPAGLNAPVATDTQEQPTNQGQFGLVSDDRMAELKERLRRKLGGQMNIGIDPEILSIGLEIAVGHLDRGIKSFTDFARIMIADLGDTIRPYLKAFYNGARDLPEVIDNGLATDMTPYDEVQQFDITNFDRTVPDLTAAATNTAREAEVTNEVNVAKQRIKRSTEKKKSLPSSSNQLNLFDNTDNNNEDAREQDTRTNNRGTQPRREELSETESVEPRTPLQHTVEIGRSKRGNTRTSGNQSGDRSLYDVNKNYSNEEISQIVSSVTDIVDGRVVITAPITDDIRAICHQYKSGGVSKKGHGILDEYYTDGKIVDAVSMLITPYFNNSNAIRVLEPSVGVGNFISAVDNIPTSEIVTFEINPTTARIAKILYPGIDVNLRSFETEFIDDAGNKKPLPQKYNLIIGNPPYGSHRGLYKGLGEESKIARYEDYFVKRSLDVLNEGGVLAMVLPSSWIDRHTRYGGYTIEAAYRLPSGAFEATQVGTDIVILRKDSSISTADHTPYFEQYPERVLGEVKQRKGRYGKMEDYVQGDIDTAIEAIKRDHAEQLANRLDIAPSNDNLNNIEEAIDETGSLDKATAIVQTAKTEANSPAPSTTTGKKGKYKTVLNRGAETVPTSLQFSHQFSEGEVEAFYDTKYDGTINHPSQHRKYANYIGGRAMHDFYYAEGDIYTKLDQLESEKKNIISTYGQEQYDKQKRLLMSVLPKRKGLSEITISPNTTFVKNLYIDTDKGSITLRDAFVDFCSKLPYQAFGDSSSWEVRGYVNNEQVYGQDKERNALVRERRKRVANDLFVKFLNEELSQSAQNQVVAAFNREYNSTYRPDYSRVPMFSTINKYFRGKPLKLTSVQLAGIGRMTVKGVGVLAHEVGFGKTLSGILAMHEAMTRGFATKPLVVVPNDNILKQWVETIKEVLPQATVNTLGNLGTNYDLTDFMVNDGEFTLVTYEGLKAMSFSDETYNRLAERFSYITEDLKKHQSERDQQKEIEKKQELKGRMKRGAKTSYGFEDFGFDWLTVDEVHNCNHIISKVRLDKSVSSDFRSQNQRTSDLGLKTWLAAQYIQEENNGRNVLLLSATPFTNKPLEYYSILSLVGNKMLERKGFFHVDQFFSTFMEADNELEIGANGRPTQKTNVRRFRNNGLFQQLLSEFIDIKGEEDNPELVRPDRHNKEYKINPNELTEDAMAAVQDLLNDNDTVLQGIGHARAAAFSPYATSLLGIQPKNHREFVKNSPKINTTIKLIEQNKKDRPDAGQIIYSEVGVEYFPLIRDYLVNESGFKPSEVRIITGATSNAERVNIQTAFNKGEVKVVIGSPAIKEGLNLQENTTDMYILSLPWNFTQLRQIEGRGWRQGNKWENIRINYMLTNNSVDVFLLQRLQLKQGLYNEAMKKGAETLDVSDIDTSELKTALITDPAVRAEIVTKQEREKLQQQRTQIEADLSFVLRKYESYNKLIEKLESKKKEINSIKEWAAGGNTYWADRVQYEENKLNAIVADIQEEKERLQKKGVNVDDIVLQTEQSQKAIEGINQKIENLKEYQEELTDKYRREQELKQQQQGDLLATYIKERKAENNNGSFYKLRPKDSQIRFRSINPDESLSDYARAVVANSQQTPPSTGLNAPVGSRSQEDLELIEAAIVRFKEYFNAPEIIQVFSRADLRKLYRDMTDDEFNETFKEYNKKAAIYDEDRNKIYTFVKNSQNTYVELIHEVTHAAIHKLYNSENLKDKLSHFVSEIEKLAPDFCQELAKAYKGDDYINELTAYTIDEFLDKKSLDYLLSQLSTQAQQELLPILKTIGYEKGRIQQSKQYARIFDTSQKIRPRNGAINDSKTRKKSLHSPEDVREDAQKPQEREVDSGEIFFRSIDDTRTADNALDSIEQATADYADSLNAERGAIIDAITPKPDDSPSTVARKIMCREIGRELVTRDNTELEKFTALPNKISNAMAYNDARHKHTAIAESQYDSMQRLHNLIDDLRKQGALIDERFDPWLTQNQSRSRAQAETNIFDLTYRPPLYDAIARGIRALFPDINTMDKAANAKGYSHLSLYAQARTAVERQAIKSAQARAEAEKKGEEYKERDFGGLAGIQEAIFGLYSAIDNDVEAAKGNIEKLTALAIERGIPTVQEYIDNAEAKLGNPDNNGTAAHQLWTAIRSISAYQLTYSYNAGLISRAGYQTLTYGRNIDGLLRERYNMQVKQIKDNSGSYDNVTDYDKDGNATGKRMVLNDNARIALNKLNKEYAKAIDNVPMPGKNGSWQQLIDTGWLTEEDVNSLHRYYMYYMPLKGHAELTAEDIAEYEHKTPRNISKIKAVEGHSHLAKDPFNQLILDTHGAIQNAEQNRWRTHLYNILTNNPNPSQYVVEQRFYKIETKSDGSKEYVPYGKVETINGAQVFIPGRPTAEELANGTAVSYNNRFTRAEVDIPIRNDQRKEHSVTVMVDGEAYTMFFYDKRIADAINGTNIKRPSDIWKQLDKLQALNRLYAGLKTSLNPTFTLISNLPRDWMEMVSNNLIEHGVAHAVASLIYRVRATRAGDVQKAIRKHQEGKLLTMADATTDVERYVVEFFNNGGSVNITQLPDYNTAKVELMDDLNTYMRTGQMPKGSAWARGFNNMAERVELAPRLATYIASRTLGRNISQSINDAKEATVNFDRKGSWSGIMGMFQLFYNAAAQSVRRQIGLARRHPLRFFATYATIGLTSPFSSIIASYISSLLLGDDDDIEDICRKYFAINPELRRRYFIILIGDDYIRIPMAVNYLPYVTLGDVFANWRYNPNYRSNPLKNTLDIASAILDTFLPSMIAQPIGFFFDTITAKNEQERAQASTSLFGSAFNRIPILEPLGQSIANYNFMGGTLFDRPFDKNSQEPAYLRARQYTQPVWVWASHLLNDITGGNEVHAGWLNIAPEQIENFMTIFGGYGEYGENVASLIGGGIEHTPQIINDVVGLYKSKDTSKLITGTLEILYNHTLGEDDFKKSIPMLSRLYGGNTAERYDKSMQSMFYADATALAQYNEYRQNATTASTRADFDRTYSPDEQRYFADLNTMQTIAERIREDVKAATPEGEAPKYHADERLKAIYNLANEQFHSLASGEYKPVDDPYYTYMYIKDAIEAAPHRTADGTYRLLDLSGYTHNKPKDKDTHIDVSNNISSSNDNLMYQLVSDYRMASAQARRLPQGYYPTMPLSQQEQQQYDLFVKQVDNLRSSYDNINLDNLYNDAQ